MIGRIEKNGEWNLKWIKMAKIKSNPPKSILTISIGFLTIYLLSDLEWTLYTSLTIGLIGVFSDFLSEKIELIWFKIAWILSLIIPNILLTFIFYIILFPIAILSKVFNKTDSLKLKNNSTSNFTTCNKEFDKKSFENPW